jgi:hypothetical protein
MTPYYKFRKAPGEYKESLINSKTTKTSKNRKTHTHKYSKE